LAQYIVLILLVFCSKKKYC